MRQSTWAGWADRAFFKKAWPIIKGDLLNAFNAFWAQDARSFHLLNDAYLVLLAKKEQPEGIGGYRPISLIHSFGKLITKCLANRLAPVLGRLVLPNQSAFIKGRCLHDNVRDVQLACRAIHKGKTPCVLLKIDIAKAFDSVSWPFLLEVLQHLGFGRRWRNWISIVLSSASTRILLNGHPGKRICHARGLRQGDPLSPMLFVMVMEVLNHLVAWLSDQSQLSEVHGLLGPRVSLYADDLVIFVVPSCDDLQLIQAALDLFGLASGLFSNLAKSVAFPLHCTDDQIAAVHLILACRIDTFPCHYLGVLLAKEGGRTAAN